MFSMNVSGSDFATIGLLIFLEGILSLDNALALAILARALPKNLQMKALLYGLVGAIVFRVGALSITSYLMKWVWVKYIGGGYLIYVAFAFWYFEKDDSNEIKSNQTANFWKTVIMIELTDIAFAVDSILTAVAVSNKLWVVITGGLIGLVMMRFASKMFIELLNRYPNFEKTAYILIFGIGVKLVLDGMNLPGVHFHEMGSAAFWCFWFYVAAAIAYGFRKAKAPLKTTMKTLKTEERASQKIDQSLSGNSEIE